MSIYIIYLHHLMLFPLQMNSRIKVNTRISWLNCSFLVMLSLLPYVLMCDFVKSDAILTSWMDVTLEDILPRSILSTGRAILQGHHPRVSSHAIYKKINRVTKSWWLYWSRVRCAGAWWRYVILSPRRGSHWRIPPHYKFMVLTSNRGSTHHHPAEISARDQ